MPWGQKAERDAAINAESESTANSFAEGHEFFNDVADAMADILDVWSKRGKKEVTEADLQRAYDIACAQDENVSQTLKSREAVEAAKTAQAATQRARIASSSVRSQPTAAAAAQPTGRRAALEAAYDDLNR